ncbi:hypothetical protein PtrSN002B_008670 [Pyrenophora tritici-repentis]|uniref:Mfs transporter n=2 Tax=Pyrenophora tritici-repentis TaxID=45151 RepID=A0A2W1D310_9PLEO|nr:uncharacterized protein PTRG_03975 [Pyrenophora tritici-repentis Pt-1C-BFP]KAA8619954.1 mfs transporter [Pyrenophora tritici-repentis]EDU46813.1 hypothetical protein PTRG_03975 [Pyrenophora tritici-repentis Pt-1C-BFP]KAF7448103.1 mfs transporter [Pyrenophora tritici-repentis]KAF7571814.1 hypothetical protein PtrM4_093140 [Pyrenophora tritici-repentis]KAG9384991.1 mfs transporter [Pyrenophora tritici-repentis]
MTLNHANVEMIPGTEIISYDASAKQTLVPVPSSDPRDPLNWGRKWKFMVMASQWLFTWIAVTGELSIAQMFPLLGKEYLSQ